MYVLKFEDIYSYGRREVDTFIAPSGSKRPRRHVGSINMFFQSEEFLVVAIVALYTSLGNV